MSHLNDPVTHLLNVQCLICTTPLRDPKSVEIGIGPVCRKKHYDAGIDEGTRKQANALIAKATAMKAKGDIAGVLSIAGGLAMIGLPKLAARVRTRFVHLQLIGKPDGWIALYTPYRKGFPRTLRNLVDRSTQRRVNTEGGTKFDHWEFHPNAKRVVYLALCKHFAGDRMYCEPTKGLPEIVRVPKIETFKSEHIENPRKRGKLTETQAQWLRDRC